MSLWKKAAKQGLNVEILSTNENQQRKQAVVVVKISKTELHKEGAYVSRTLLDYYVADMPDNEGMSKLIVKAQESALEKYFGDFEEEEQEVEPTNVVALAPAAVEEPKEEVKEEVKPEVKAKKKAAKKPPRKRADVKEEEEEVEPEVPDVELEVDDLLDLGGDLAEEESTNILFDKNEIDHKSIISGIINQELGSDWKTDTGKRGKVQALLNALHGKVEIFDADKKLLTSFAVFVKRNLS